MELVTLPDNVTIRSTPQIQVSIKSKLHVALLDCCASKSYISPTFAHSLKLHIEPGNFQATTLGNSTKVMPTGICEITFFLNEKKYTHEFLLLEGLVSKLILGYDFIQKSGLILDGKNGTYWFSNSRKFKLYSCSNQEFLCALQGLTNAQSNELDSLLQEFPEVFSDTLGCTNMVQCEVSMSDGPPVCQKPYPTNPKKRAMLKEHIDEMLKLGVIVPSESEWASPVYLHTKDKKNFRFVVDMRKINQRCKSDPFPIPRIDTLVHKLGEASFLTALDLKKGYWQIGVHPDSRKYFAIICDEGKFEFVRMPFGYKNGPSVFQRAANKVLGKARGVFAEAYLDDIIIYSRTWEEHLQHIRYVLKQLRRFKFSLNKSKCEFGKTSLRYLGYMISPEGIQPDKEKVFPVLNYQRPKSTSQIKRFLGMAGWYRHYINHFSDIAEPLNKLLRKGAKFRWENEQVEAFEKLKNSIANACILSFPDYNRKFILRTDASNVGLGCVLAQEYDGLEKPIAFASRSLSEQERSYHATEKECLCIVYALKKFQHFLDGQEFELQTDNKALLWLNKMKDLNSKFMRWSLKIQDFQPIIKHCPGKLNVVADALSRAPLESIDSEEINSLNSDVSLLLSLTDKISLEQIKLAQLEDDETKALLTDLPNDFIFDNDVLYKKGKHSGRLVFIPKALRNHILSYFHDNQLAGHMGYRKTTLRLTRRVFWFGMHEDIYAYVKSCKTCQSVKNPSTLPSGDLQSVRSKGPWDMLCVDLVGPLPRTKGGKTILLVVTDHFSKWVELFALSDGKANKICEKLENEVFCRFGYPHFLLSDNGTQFTSKLMNKLCKSWGIKHKFTSYYHPQANLTERINRNIRAILSAYVHKKHSKWDENLQAVAFALRTAISDSTGYSPSMLTFGREISFPFDRWQEEDESEIDSRIEYKNALIDRLSQLYSSARQNIEKAQEHQAKYYNRRHKKRTFKIGDLVLVRTHYKSEKARKFIKKFAFRWEGPYKIAVVISPVTFKLEKLDSTDLQGTHNVKNLKPYYDRPNTSFVDKNATMNSNSTEITDSVRKCKDKNKVISGQRKYNFRSTK